MKITRETLEKQQIWIYGATLVIGGLAGIAGKDSGLRWGWTISPLIAVLMYAMFAQIPFLKLREAMSNLKFMAALLIGNFLAVPVVVWVLTAIFPQSPPILSGVCLVLLTPCIDYVIVFTQLGKGNERLILASTPVLFAVQMVFIASVIPVAVYRERSDRSCSCGTVSGSILIVNSGAAAGGGDDSIMG
ncbi:hypothetical protein Bamy02_32420 [Bacillus amyloliquefaciens]|nr:hypothetical protein Bamy02_32420 [Bacillus amyloliquefaciens]